MRLELGDGAWLELHDWLDPREADRLMQKLLGLSWKQQTVQIWGKIVQEPRQVMWVGDPAAVYRYSGRTNVPEPWLEQLAGIRRQLAKIGSFNSCLLNHYRDGQDSIGLHSDDEPELRGPIASVSLGATRQFQIRHRATNGRYNLQLQHGSLLVMGGTMQQLWRHGIPKEPRVTGARINLTFRQVDAARLA